MKRRIQFKYFDKLLFVIPILIFLIGIVSIYSASYKSARLAEQSLVMKQVLWMGIGVLCFFLIVRFDYFRFRDFAWPLYLVSIIFLVLVLFMPARLGAHRWIPLGGFNLQPSELAKLAVILILSHFLANHKPEYTSKWKLAIPALLVALPILLIMREPDLGTALTLVPVFLALLYLWGVRPKYLLLFLLVAALVSPVFFSLLKEYQKARLLVFVNPNADPLGAGYTIIQSKIAIGSGGLLGKGFLGGTQNQLNFLPERHTDFIFSVVAEETGFLGSITILTLFMLIVKKGYSICIATRDKFGSFLAGGISTLLAVQIIINLGMTMGLLPVVGMPLPLVSYGGSSVVLTMALVAILQNIRMYRSPF